MSLKEKIEKFISGWVQATQEQFTGHPTANLFRQGLKEEIEGLVKDFEPSFEVKASVGAGNWANVPWLSILSPKITTTTQDGIYPVYLFKADGSGCYLSLNQGTTIPTRYLKKKGAEERSQKIKRVLLEQLPELEKWGIQEIDLNANTVLGKSYEKPNISAKYYEANNIPDDLILKQDLLELLAYYKQIEFIDIKKELGEAKPYPSPKEMKKMTHVASMSLSKPFLLLAGISGSGKTRFVREQAQATGNLNDTYCLISVRPDWHEPSDLLGYVSRLGSQPRYIATDVLRFIVRAWKEIIELITFDTTGVPYDWCGRSLEYIRPYWLCLDEMNLAPVEQYFSDYLSILETRSWNNPKKLQETGLDYVYECEPLIKGEIFQAIESEAKGGKENSIEQLAADLDLDLSNDLERDIWQYFLHHGIAIPFNLIVAGTVNMDETTHGFSRKVIDRALSFDFGEFFPNDFDHFFTPNTQNKTLSYPILSHARLEDLPAIDSNGKKSIGFLKAVNQVLDNTPFKLAYRALNELLLAVVSQNPQDDIELKAAWDDFLMCKVLPRIEGDCDKLVINSTDQSLLKQLEQLLATEFAEFWNELGDSPTARPDLYREYKEGGDQVIRVACRSKEKLDWMQKRLENSGFTSFWP
ncbi:hypothetical protein AB204_05915 [Xenorhabdus khoisanae]|uniref:Type IV methyl-directed restriction enzyme EcoKMcrB subunit DNA-binding domain-containing protein n=1 Tax=Xenorhabdus khoisanae TaxID=880157 RepID=A0A0J5FUT9_9GAMM|nr:DUF3578 domain-containing protein [Xenorhabdus khoisanae]KMJ46003.1 hypothetical protein AB204_05915 [Xenorhabdus khoisanae]